MYLYNYIYIYVRCFFLFSAYKLPLKPEHGLAPGKSLIGTDLYIFSDGILSSDMLISVKIIQNYIKECPLDAAGFLPRVSLRIFHLVLYHERMSNKENAFYFSKFPLQASSPTRLQPRLKKIEHNFDNGTNNCEPCRMLGHHLSPIYEFSRKIHNQ